MTQWSYRPEGWGVETLCYLPRLQVQYICIFLFTTELCLQCILYKILYQFKILKTWCAISSWGWILLHFMAAEYPVIWNWLSTDAPGVASTVLPFSARSILTSCWSEPSIVYNTFTKLRQGARSYITLLWALPFNSGAGGRWLFLHKQGP